MFYKSGKFSCIICWAAKQSLMGWMLEFRKTSLTLSLKGDINSEAMPNLARDKK
jgi:hypothetical protein